MDDEMDSTDDVQFADVSAVLQEEQEEEELNFFCHLTIDVPHILSILLPQLILTRLPHRVFLENYTEVQCQVLQSIPVHRTGTVLRAPTIHGGPHFAQGDTFSANAQRRRAPRQPEAGEKKKRRVIWQRTRCSND